MKVWLFFLSYHFVTFLLAGTPILGGVRSKERFLALERRKNTIMAGGDMFEPPGNLRTNAMQTLGHKNQFVRNNAQRSTLDTKRPSKGAAPLPPQQQQSQGQSQYGVHNGAYHDDDNDELDLNGDQGPVNSLPNRNVINMSIYGERGPRESSRGTRRSNMNNSEV